MKYTEENCLFLDGYRSSFPPYCHFGSPYLNQSPMTEAPKYRVVDMNHEGLRPFEISRRLLLPHSNVGRVLGESQVSPAFQFLYQGWCQEFVYEGQTLPTRVLSYGF